MAGRDRRTRSRTWPGCASATPRSSAATDRSSSGQGPVRTGVTVVVPHDGNVFTEPRLRRQPSPQRQRRADRARVDPRGRPSDRADRDHEHPQRRRRPRRDHPDCRPDTAVRDVVLGAAGRRRDVGRPAQRHRRLPRDDGPRRRGAGGGPGRCRRGGQRRRRDRDGLPRVQGRDRDGVPGDRRGRAAAGPSACSSRRTTAGATGCASTACRSARRSRSTEIPSPYRPEDEDLPPAPPAGSGSIIVVVATDAPLLPHQCERLAQRAGLGIARMGGTGSHSSGDLFVCFATGNRGLPHTTFASDPRLDGRRPIGQRPRHRRAVRRRHRGDRGGDPQRPRRRPDDDRPRRDHRPRPAARSARRGHDPLRARATADLDRVSGPERQATPRPSGRRRSTTSRDPIDPGRARQRRSASDGGHRRAIRAGTSILTARTLVAVDDDRSRRVRRDRVDRPRPASQPICSSGPTASARDRRGRCSTRCSRRLAADDVRVRRSARAAALHPGRDDAALAEPLPHRRRREPPGCRPGLDGRAGRRRPTRGPGAGLDRRGSVGRPRVLGEPGRSADSFVVVDGGRGRRRPATPATRQKGAGPRARPPRRFGPAATRSDRSVAALRRAARGGPVGACIPGPNPAVRPLLEAGFRIEDRDTFMASEPDLVDPARLLPNPGML